MWTAIDRLLKNAAPKVPRGVRIYAIGDIHGRVDLLTEVFKRIDADARRSPSIRTIEVYLGDYIDRGPASREVLNNIIVRSLNHEMMCLKGNHEFYPGEFAINPGILREWSQIGGFETLLSYGVNPPTNFNESSDLSVKFGEIFPRAHRMFLDQLKPYFVCGDFFFVHAGVRPGVSLKLQTEEDLLWIRDEFLQSEDDHGKIIVHGHTPVIEPEFKPNRINIDTGAYATGRLTCLGIEGDRLSLI